MLTPQSSHQRTFPGLLIGFVALTFLEMPGGASFGAEVSGEPRIVDGDTIEIGHIKIRFAGIDAPETDQICLDSKGDRWACGVTSRDELIKYSGKRSWDCDLIGTDKYGRSLGKCFIEGEDVSAWMVQSGWALSFCFLDDGRIELDANTFERAIRPITLGRKNHLFAGSDGGAARWATVCSLITTAKLNDAEPFAYLKDVLERMSGGHPMSRLDELLPWNWTHSNSKGPDRHVRNGR